MFFFTSLYLISSSFPGSQLVLEPIPGPDPCNFQQDQSLEPQKKT